MCLPPADTGCSYDAEQGPRVGQLMKWWDGSRGPRCYVQEGDESVWVVTTGCGGCQTSDLWAAAPIMTSQKDGTTLTPGV